MLVDTASLLPRMTPRAHLRYRLSALMSALGFCRYLLLWTQPRGKWPRLLFFFKTHFSPEQALLCVQTDTMPITSLWSFCTRHRHCSLWQIVMNTVEYRYVFNQQVRYEPQLLAIDSMYEVQWWITQTLWLWHEHIVTTVKPLRVNVLAILHHYVFYSYRSAV